MQTRIIHTKVWDDEWFQGLSDDAQRLFIYLLTCQDVNQCGMFEITDRKLTYYIRFEGERLKKAKKELEPKVIFHNSWVYIKNINKFNKFRGDRNVSASLSELLKVPTDFIEYIRSIDTSMDTSIYTTLNHNLNHNTNLNLNHAEEEPIMTREFMEEMRSKISEKLQMDAKERKKNI